MADCLFCKLATDPKVPKVHEDADTVAFRDINPQAPTHVLIIPRRHIASISEMQPGDAELVGKLFLTARSIAAAEKLDHGWRTVFNVGRDAGQTVFHIHLHLIGGRPLGWPPG